MSANMEDIIKKLKEPFPFSEIECKIQTLGKDKISGMVVFYVDSRAIQNRLDKVVKPFNWRNEYVQWHGNAQICGISIIDEDRKIWVTKFDGAENTIIEPVKGGLSDSFKRAAVMWGIGRYLYDIPGKWVAVEPKDNNKGHKIKDGERATLKDYYNECLKNPGGNKNASSTEQTSTSGDGDSTSVKPSSSSTKNTADDKPKSSSGNTEVEGKPTSTNKGYFKVKSAKETENSVYLTLLGNGNKEYTAFARKGSKGLLSGVLIKNTVLEEKQSNNGVYYLLNKYEIENTAA